MQRENYGFENGNSIIIGNSETPVVFIKREFYIYIHLLKRDFMVYVKYVKRERWKDLCIEKRNKSSKIGKKTKRKEHCRLPEHVKSERPAL